MKEEILISTQKRNNFDPKRLNFSFFCFNAIIVNGERCPWTIIRGETPE